MILVSNLTETFTCPCRMYSTLTRAQQYRILCTCPKVEQLILPLIIENACEEKQPLQEYFTPATKTFKFIKNGEDPFLEDDTGIIQQWAGIINRWNQLSPGAFTIVAHIDCYEVEWEYHGHLETGIFTRLSQEWFQQVARYFRRDQLSIEVLPPPANCDQSTRNRWAQWMEMYEQLAHRVRQLPYEPGHIFPALPQQ